LRQFKDHIFAEIGRQVHAIVVNHHGILPFPNQQRDPRIELKRPVECAQAAGALERKRPGQPTLEEDASLVPFGNEGIVKRPGRVNQFIEVFNGKFPRIKFALEPDGVSLDVSDV
jgi:hypothetical protein